MEEVFPVLLLWFLPMLAALLVIYRASGLSQKKVAGGRASSVAGTPPLKASLLRAPGSGLLRELNEIQNKALDCFLLMVFPPGIVAVLGVNFRLGPRAVTLVVFCLLVFIIYEAIRLQKILRRRRDVLIGLDAEMSVGMELDRLMLRGMRVFHGLPAGGSSIDHVVIGSTGVFTVETVGRTKPRDEGPEGAQVRLDGRTLKFPNGIDADSIPQAETGGARLADFLRKSVGREIPVKPVVALPGWSIEHGRQNGAVPVINPRNAEQFFADGPAIVDEKTIEEVAQQVEQRCRALRQVDTIC